MSFCVSSLRLLVITLLFLCSVVDIETNAIPQLYSKDGRNENRGGISSNSSDITTYPTKEDLTNVYVDSNMEYDDKRGMDLNEGLKPEVVTNSLENITTTDIGTPDASTTDSAVIQPTTPTYIYSVTTKRSKINRMISERNNRNTTTTEGSPTTSKGTVMTSNNADKNKTPVDDSELANIDIEDDEDADVPLPSTKSKHNNNVSTGKSSKNSKLNDTNVKNVIPVADSNKNKSDQEKPNTRGQNSQSHIYKVNSNYKRYKKLNILPPKSIWRDPNDNSWRNESISSLGIKFKPKSNSTKGFQFRKKDLSELEPLMSETGTGPGLRERLEKLSEIRKSKKKHNASAEMSDEEVIDYENYSIDSSHTETTPIVTPNIHITTLKTTTSASPETTSIRMQPEPHKRKHGMNDLKDSKLISDRRKNEMPNTVRKKPEIVNARSNFREVKRQKPKDQVMIKLPTEDQKTSEVIRSQVRKDPEKSISNSNYKEVKYQYEKDQMSTKDVKNKQFDYSLEPKDNDEIHDYELEISKELINSSESWSEKKTVNSKTNSTSFTTEINTVRESTNILDSLEDYLNINTPSTTSITPSRIQQSSDFYDTYIKLKYQKYDKALTKTDAYVTSKFANPIDLPIGPRNKHKISLPQSYSYNTMPHKEISVQYNTSVIHKPNKERSNSNYNGEHILSSSLNEEQSTEAIFSSYHPDKSDHVQNHEFENPTNSNHKYLNLPNSRTITEMAPVPQIHGAEFSEIVNIEHANAKIEPVPQNIATTYQDIPYIPPNFERIAQPIVSMPQHIDSTLQNNVPHPREPVHDDHTYIADLPDISQAISQNIPPQQNINNHRIYHTNVAPFNELASHVRENAIIGGQSISPNIREELLSMNTRRTPLIQEHSNRPMHQNIAFNEPLHPNVVSQPPNPPIVPSNLGQPKSQYETSVLPNMVLQSVSREEFIFQNINNVKNINVETDMPLLYNSTVLHTLNTDRGHDTPVSNSYMKSLYEEVASKKLQDVGTTTVAMAYIEGDRVEPGYLIHYNIPHQDNFPNPKVITHA